MNTTSFPNIANFMSMKQITISQLKEDNKLKYISQQVGGEIWVGGEQLFPLLFTFSHLERRERPKVEDDDGEEVEEKVS